MSEDGEGVNEEVLRKHAEFCNGVDEKEDSDDEEEEDFFDCGRVLFGS